MALIVETGSIVASAESYCTVAFADTYHENRANTAWDSVDEKEAYLRKATDYMMQAYRHRWKGSRVSVDQPLDWPRNGVCIDTVIEALSYGNYIHNDIVPLEVQKACAELALKASASELMADQERGIVSETIGPLSTTYDRYSPQSKRYKTVDALLAPYLTGSSNSMNVVRS